jgi:transcriptional regulator with XRE-family HTH domain
MHPIKKIRRDIFRTTQSAFADIAGVNQATVSRWERGEFEPSRDEMAKIRDEARRRRIRWNDSLFFDAVGERQ